MDEKLFLIIKTDSYVGNFEKKLMAYVFGYSNDSSTYSELELFSYDMGEQWRETFLEYLDKYAYGQKFTEFTCYDIGSHPTNKEYNCDSIFIGLKKSFPKDIATVIMNRLNDFCDYHAKSYKEEIKVLDINYYHKNIEIQKDENLSF